MARTIEEAGIPTVSLSSALDITLLVKPPRAVFVNYPLGNQCGKPFDRANQHEILLAALRCLETSTVPGRVLQLPFRWREDDSLDLWEEEEFHQPSAR
jgi:D-proline reductase (dithiol) PrdB